MRLKLNQAKMKLRQTKVKYIGQVFTSQSFKADQEKIQAMLNMPAPEDCKGSWV